MGKCLGLWVVRVLRVNRVVWVVEVPRVRVPRVNRVVWVVNRVVWVIGIWV